MEPDKLPSNPKTSILDIKLDLSELFDTSQARSRPSSTPIVTFWSIVTLSSSNTIVWISSIVLPLLGILLVYSSWLYNISWEVWEKLSFLWTIHFVRSISLHNHPQQILITYLPFQRFDWNVQVVCLILINHFENLFSLQGYCWLDLFNSWTFLKNYHWLVFWTNCQIQKLVPIMINQSDFRLSGDPPSRVKISAIHKQVCVKYWWSTNSCDYLSEPTQVHVKTIGDRSNSVKTFSIIV